jgi:hypothetical protein
MKIYTSIFCLIIITLAQFSCKPTEKKVVIQNIEKPSIDWKFLKQTWIFLEEDSKTFVREYRPKGFEFPPSRGRDAYDFQENGELVYHGIGAADQPTETKGKWELDSVSQTIKLSFYKNKMPSQQLKVKSLTKDVLKLEIVRD